MKNFIKKRIFNKSVLNNALLFLMSGACLHESVSPFGLPAFIAWGKAPFGILMYILGLISSKAGFASYLRHIIGISLYLVIRNFTKGKIPDFFISGIAVLIGGIASAFVWSGDKLMYLSFVATEALFTAVFTVIFSRAADAVFEKMRGNSFSGADFSFFAISLMCLSLSFSDIEIGRISISATLMLILGMISAYRHTPSVSTVVNMAAGLFCLLFTPENTASVIYLAVSGFVASLIKRYGKFIVPVVYLLIYPLFIGAKVNITTFYCEDVFLASAAFLLIPEKVTDFINILPGASKEEASCLRLKERINSLADTFYSVAQLFSGANFRADDKSLCNPSAETVGEVCRECVYKGRCSDDARKVLEKYDGKRKSLLEKDIICRKKKELLSSFAAKYNVMRMEKMWIDHIREENEAMTNQMACIAEAVKDAAEEKEIWILRNEAEEAGISDALKKRGIKVRKIIAGRNKKGLFKVNLELAGCKENNFCSGIIPSVIFDITGVKVERCGINQCSPCRINYSELSGYEIECSHSKASPEDISGDSFLSAYIDETSYVLALSDGMGTGIKAKYKSETAVTLLLRLIAAGMDLPSSVSMVNSLLLRCGGREFVTLDVAIINPETGEVFFSKYASVSGYLLKNNGKVKILSGKGSPLGIMGKPCASIEKVKISEGDLLIMVSDGISDCFGGDEERMAEKIEEFTFGGTKELADFILSEALKISGKGIKDDMTVIAVGCIKKHKIGKDKKKGGLVCEKRQKSNNFG